MDDRIVEFIRALRNSGVRVSLAENLDAMHAVQAMGIAQREAFKAALRTTLVKDKADIPMFEELFPAFFSVGTPPMQQMMGGGMMRGGMHGQSGLGTPWLLRPRRACRRRQRRPTSSQWRECTVR